MNMGLFKKKGFRQVMIRLAIFIALYLLILFFHADFTDYFYGYIFGVNDGYTPYLIFAVLGVFGFLRWEIIKSVKSYKNSLLQTLVFGGIAMGIFVTPVKFLVTEWGINPVGSYFIPLFTGFSFLFLAVFNLKFIKLFLQELIILALIILSYIMTQVLIEGFWIYSSKAITYTLSICLPWISDNVIVNSDTLNIQLEEFSVFIGPPCAGIYSMTAFTLLFVTSLLLMRKWRDIHYFSALLVYLGGLIVVFLLNIVRVMIILYVGAYYSRELAIDLFHEYLSAIFLLGLFTLYLYFIVPKISSLKKG